MIHRTMHKHLNTHYINHRLFENKGCRCKMLNIISKAVCMNFNIRPVCLHFCRFSLINLSLTLCLLCCLLVYFSTPWADSSHTCSSSYLEEGTKPELGHWFELILDLLAILNQLLSCKSSPQTQLSFFLGGDNVVVVAK